jgi:hypothetical protein
VERSKKAILVDELQDPFYTLAEWRDKINALIAQHGEGKFLYTDAGYSNVSMILEDQDHVERVRAKQEQDRKKLNARSPVRRRGARS